MYLNDDFAGGETAMMESVIKPVRGMALFFQHELVREGRPVLSAEPSMCCGATSCTGRSGRCGGDLDGQPLTNQRNDVVSRIS